MTREAERAYTTQEAADMKSVSKDTILRAIRRTEGNSLPATPLGRGYRIKASELDAWFDRLGSV